MKVKNKNSYLKKIILFIFVFVLLTTLSTKIKINQAYAVKGEIVGIFCANNPGTQWQVAARIKDAATGIYTGWAYIWADGTDAHCSGYLYAGVNFFGPMDTTSTLVWHTACVDPVQPLNTVHLPLLNWYVFQQDVTCSGNWLYGNPASCNNVNNLGRVSSGVECPSGPYCMVGGATDGVLCPGAFDGSGTHTCNGTICTPVCSGPVTYACTGTPPHCEKYTWAVRDGVCGSGPNAQVAESYCNSGAGCTSTPTPTYNTCTAGTGGNNPASCGGFDKYAIQPSSGLCCEYVWQCYNGSCVEWCHDTSAAVQSQCTSTITCRRCNISNTCEYYPYSEGATCPMDCNACTATPTPTTICMKSDLKFSSKL
jgi:hypothetical protein